MRAVEWICKQLDRLLMVFVSLLAAVCLLYSCYVLFDIFYNNNKAYVSNDLLQYRPKADAAGEVSMEELKAINEDVVGWITIPGTNIDYPVVQGADDLHYSSHDVYGNGSLTGSIYMAAGSSPELEDYYTIIYGHHMANGAMFGDIDKYEDAEYFAQHSHGTVTAQNGVWDLDMLACVHTDAYERTVYSTADRDEKGIAELHEYIRENAVQYNAAMTEEKLAKAEKLIALSTCADATTNGRLVLFCTMTPRQEEGEPEETSPAGRLPAGIRLLASAGGISGRLKAENAPAQPQTESAAPEAESTVPEDSPAEPVPETTKAPVKRVAVGHGAPEKRWAFMNLIALAFTLYNLVPLGNLKRKYRQRGYCVRTMKALDDPATPIGKAAAEKPGLADRLKKDLLHYRWKMAVGGMIEGAILLAGVLLFLSTEDMSRSVTLRDDWTGWMLLILFCAWLTDVICFRYRGERITQLKTEE